MTHSVSKAEDTKVSDATDIIFEVNKTQYQMAKYLEDMHNICIRVQKKYELEEAETEKKKQDAKLIEDELQEESDDDKDE